MDDLTPKQIVAELDKYIVGQSAAKRAVAIALRNRYRRRLLPEDMQHDVVPKNILMIGPTGVGKTEIARRLASLARAPFIKVEATKFTEVGYVGRDVDSMIRDLVQVSIRLVEAERLTDVEGQARERAVDRVVDILHPRRADEPKTTGPAFGFGEWPAGFEQMFGSAPMGFRQQAPAAAPVDDELSRKKHEQDERVREHLRKQVSSGARDAEVIEVTVEEAQTPPVMPIMGPMGGGDAPGGGDMGGFLASLMPKKSRLRKMTISEAKAHFQDVEARALVDQDQITREAIVRAEQTGIVFIDEMDKIAGRTGSHGGPDVSREGVQRDILPIIEGSTVQTKFGPVETDHILFIAAGAFHLAKPSDLIPELQGRLPIRVELDNLTQEDFVRILTEPRHALVHQYTALLATDGARAAFTPDGIAKIAELAAEVNAQMENIGARRLHTVMERLLEQSLFDAGDGAAVDIVVDAAFVSERLAGIAKNEDLSRYIL